MAKTLETPHAGDLLLRLIGSEHHRLVEVEVDRRCVGKPLSTVRNERDGLVLGVVGAAGVSLGIGEEPRLESGDKLLIAEPLQESSRSRR